MPDAEPHQPGRFYLRELPPLRGPWRPGPDGTAHHRRLRRARAREEFGVPVIGVAKSTFCTATHAIPVLRGTSARPLYVTAAGMPRADATDLVRHMASQHRLLEALRRVDSLARHGLPQPPQR